jgi:phosphoserine phosphatase RsbU/P
MPAGSSLVLVTLAGPPVGPFAASGDRVTMIGRAADCAICLLDDAVSRRHASLVRKRGSWFVTDSGSTGGTFLNGVRLPRATPTPIGPGDLIRIGPWAFRAVVGESGPRAASTVDDAHLPTLRIERAASTDAAGRSDRRLKLLTECIARLGAAGHEEAAARTLLDLALQGTGYARGAVLRRLGGADGRVEVVASARADPADREAFTFSRSLLDQAASDETVVLTRQSAPGPQSHSLAELGIHSAVCVPIHVAGALTEFLYLDARGHEGRVHADATGFCEAAATAFGLAVGNFKRGELERRQNALQAELTAAREVQHLVMPPTQGQIARARYAVVSRPGSFVAGDLFDALELPGDRAAFCLGDVSGHGVGAAMLMAAAQSALSAELLRLAPDQGPAPAVAALNAHLARRPLGGRFLSLWVGVLWPDGRLCYCDAGHGHWLLLRPANDIQRAHACDDGGIPVGIDPDARFHERSVHLADTDQVVLYSDGIVEQRAPSGEPFGVDRMLRAVAIGQSAQEDVALVMRELDRFAATPSLDDDATVAAFEFIGGE